MGTETIDRPRVGGPGSDLSGNWSVIVLNDDHNTFDHVAASLAATIPGVDIGRGHAIAERVHKTGRALVWSGPREIAEHYWQELKSAGLTMAALERS